MGSVYLTFMATYVSVHSYCSNGLKTNSIRHRAHFSVMTSATWMFELTYMNPYLYRISSYQSYQHFFPSLSIFLMLARSFGRDSLPFSANTLMFSTLPAHCTTRFTSSDPLFPTVMPFRYHSIHSFKCVYIYSVVRRDNTPSTPPSIRRLITLYFVF